MWKYVSHSLGIQRYVTHLRQQSGKFDDAKKKKADAELNVVTHSRSR